MCKSKEIKAVFLPCEHKVACQTHAWEIKDKTEKCPICRSKIESIA